MPSLLPAEQRLTGYVDRVTYHNEESGYSILKVKVDKQREVVTMLCQIASVSAGEHFEARGEWGQHREFGRQFKAASVTTYPPSSRAGIEKYLASGLLRGVGPSFAKRLIEKFGEDVFEMLDHHPDRLREVAGIGRGRQAKIIASWTEQREIRKILVFLQSHGVSTAKATRIYKTYGQTAISQITENPFRLARDIPGLGFKSADRIAGRLGTPPDSPVRLRAGLQHTLDERIRDGHCGYPRAELLRETADLLEVAAGGLNPALRLEIDEGYVAETPVSQTLCIFKASLARAEEDIARRLLALREGSPPWSMSETELKSAVERVEKELGLELAPEQRQAVFRSLSGKLMILTGGPGTGKTTLTRVCVDILGRHGMRVSLCSPTGRAAKRLSECTGREAKTIHRLLGHDRNRGGFFHHDENPLPLDLLLVDEASMIDVFLMHSLLKAIPPSAALILVGDVDQIPSVGAGAVLASLIDSETIATIRLQQIFRQAEQSEIIANAHQINRGEMPHLENRDSNSDFFFLAEESPDRLAATVVDLVQRRLPRRYGFDPAREIQVLCPMNRGVIGTQALNLKLQGALNPRPSAFVERFGSRYAVGDKVMATANNYDKDVFNGDVGFITAVHPEDQVAAIDFDGRRVEYDFGELDSLLLAYATTIHKAQGSEYPVVILPIHVQQSLMLRKNLIYTGVTRGKKLVILVGQKRALAQAVNARDQTRRWTKLAEWLRESGESRARRQSP